MLATAFSHEPEIARLDVVKEHAPISVCEKGPLEMLARPIRVIEAKEHIFRDGDPVSHVYQVEVGHVCIYKMMPDGRRQVIDFAYPGDMIGLGALSGWRRSWWRCRGGTCGTARIRTSSSCR